jgi:hypothetical protein
MVAEANEPKAVGPTAVSSGSHDEADLVVSVEASVAGHQHA